MRVEDMHQCSDKLVDKDDKTLHSLEIVAKGYKPEISQWRFNRNLQLSFDLQKEKVEQSEKPSRATAVEDSARPKPEPKEQKSDSSKSHRNRSKRQLDSSDPWN